MTTTQELIALRKVAETLRDAELPHPKWQAENTFKAAFNYGTAIELLDHIESLSAEVERLKTEQEAGAVTMRWMMKSHNKNYDDLTAERDQLRTDYAAKCAELELLHESHDTLRAEVERLTTALEGSISVDTYAADLGAVEKERDQLSAEVERQRVQLVNQSDWLVEWRKWEAEAKQLRAQLEAQGEAALPVAWRWLYQFKDIGETGAYEHHSHDFAVLAHMPKGEPLYTHPAPAAPVVEPPNLDQIVDNFIEDYEMQGEDESGRDAYYIPNENDRALLKDAICGLLADTEWDKAWCAHIQALAALRPTQHKG